MSKIDIFLADIKLCRTNCTPIGGQIKTLTQAAGTKHPQNGAAISKMHNTQCQKISTIWLLDCAAIVKKFTNHANYGLLSSGFRSKNGDFSVTF